MKRFIFTIFLLIFFNYGSYSQSCLPEGILFTAQAQIDSFQVNYPGCTEIEGDVIIQESISGCIINLHGLIQLTSILGDLNISFNDTLANILGLDSLSYIAGSLTITDNHALNYLSGLENLTYIGQNLTIGSAYLSGIPSVITDLMGLQNLNYIGGDLSVLYNGSLLNLAGLDNVTIVRGDLKIRYNLEMTTLTGLEGLHSIPNGYIDIRSNNALLNLTGLENITKIDGQLNFIDNESLESLDGIEQLSSMWGNLCVENNPSLVNISGLSGLYTMGGHLIIKYNSVLESLSGLDNVIENSIGNLEIAYNESLTNCEASSICDYLAQPNGNIEIHDNATGCNSEAEVDSACVYLLNSNANDLSSFLIYPSPTSTSIKIELPGSIRPIKNTFLTINNIDGQQLIERQISELQTMVDVIGLDAGIYFVKVIMDDKVQVGKFVKE